MTYESALALATIAACASLACFCCAGGGRGGGGYAPCMPSAAAAATIRTLRSRHHDELLALIDARATREGRIESVYPGLAYYRFSKGQVCRKAPVPGATLAVIVQGRKTVRIGDHVLHTDPMHHLVITRETASLESTTHDAGPGQPYLSLSLTFRPETIVKALTALADVGEPRLEPCRESVPAFVSPVLPEVADALARLLRAVDDDVERRVVAPLVVEECALRLMRCDAAAAVRAAIRGDGDAAKVEEAMRFMRDSAARPLSVPEIARHVGMSASHFAHRFRELARLSPMRYLRQVRLEGARSLMLSEGMRPSEAAPRVGFESAAHFSREFKRTYGASPAEYVRRLRQ
jgi:AraC-like DNA-binding protein